MNDTIVKNEIELLPWNQSNLRQDILDNFWSKILIPRNPDGLPNYDLCWEFDGCTNRDGYPILGHNEKGRTHLGNRLMFECCYGPIKENMCICHSCDNPSCVNPTHLWEGTDAQNTADKVNKNRQLTGSNVGNSKLTEDDIFTMLEGILTNKFTTVSEISEACNTTDATIFRILNGKIWICASNSICTELNCDLHTLRIKIAPVKFSKIDLFDILEGIHNNRYKCKADILKVHNVYRSTINRILNGSTWKHIVKEICEQLGCTLNELYSKI